jgi:hypothetical protein
MPCAHADNFSSSFDKNFLFGKLSCKKKEKNACYDGKRLFFSQESSPPIFFCPRMMKNGQHQHKDRPHMQKKSQGSVTSAEDAIIILRGLDLYGAHCRLVDLLK